MRFHEAGEALDNSLQGIIPAGFAIAAVFVFDHRVGQAVTRFQISVGEASLGTEVTVVDLGIIHTADPDYLVITEFNLDAAANTAVSTDRGNGFVRFVMVVLVTIRDGIRGANIRAGATGDAGAARKGAMSADREPAVSSAARDAEHKLPLDLLADIEAEPAVDTGFVAQAEVGMGFRCCIFSWLLCGLADLFVEAEKLAAQGFDLRSVGADVHALLKDSMAGGHGTFRFLTIHQTDPATTFRGGFFRMTDGGDTDSKP